MHSSFLDFPRERTEFSDTTYAMIGRALAYATAFEAICRTLNSLQYVRDRVQEIRTRIQEPDDAFALAIAEIWNVRLHKHVRSILQYRELPSDIGAAIKAAKAARNEIAHELALGLPDTIETDTFRSDLVFRLSQLVDDLSKGFAIIGLTSLSETNEPLPTQNFLSSYPARIVDWITKP